MNAAYNCGTISYAISPSLSFVSFDSALREISVVSSNAADVGTHSMSLTAKLDSFPINTQVMLFLITIDSCIVTSTNTI